MLAKILLSIAAVQYSVFPLFADLSSSHLFHVDWPPHARFHLVWALAMGTGIAIYMMFLVWGPADNRKRNLLQACFMGMIVPIGFFVATLGINAYGGALADPLHSRKILGTDGNLLSLSIAFTIQAVATILVSMQNEIEERA